MTHDGVFAVHRSNSWLTLPVTGVYQDEPSGIIASRPGHSGLSKLCQRFSSRLPPYLGGLFTEPVRRWWASKSDEGGYGIAIC